MRTDLSSQIKLDRIPRRYYNPDNEIELTALRREEKLFTRIFETISDGGDFIASEMARYINRYTEQKGRCVLALGAGVSTHRAYASLIKLYNEGRVDFSNVIIYIIDEFFPLLPEGPSVLKRLREILLDHINIKPENVRTINPEITKETMYEYCQAYEQAIADDGGIDLAVFEIGPHSTRPARPNQAIAAWCFSATKYATSSARITTATKFRQPPSHSAWQISVRPSAYSLWLGVRTAPKLSARW